MLNGASLDADSCFQGFQIDNTFKKQTEVISFFYYFNKIPNIPDGNEIFEMNFAVVQIGAKIELARKPMIVIAVDYYNNLKGYNSNDSIPEKSANQKQGLVVGLTTGSLKKQGTTRSRN